MLQYLVRNLQHRQFRLAPRAGCDVLILLDREEEYLRECIPPGVTVRTCPIDREIPIVPSIRFLAGLVRAVLGGMRPGPAILSALIKAWDPAVVLTGETVYDLPGEVAESFPDKSFIVISRCLLVPPMLPKKLPIFYSFGHYDKEVLDQEGVAYQEHHPIGSVKAEIIRRRMGKPEGGFDLCFISQYRVPIAERDYSAVPPGQERWFNDMFDAYNSANATALEFAHRYAVRSGLTLCVATATRESDSAVQEKEREYFRTLVRPYTHFNFIPRTNTSSYEAVLSSKVAISVDSALGFEALGLGQKVFFFVGLASMRGYLEKHVRGSNPIYYAKLPEELTMQSDNFLEFEAKLTRLLALGEDEYLRLIAPARAYYMNNAGSLPPDEYLRANIAALVGVRARRLAPDSG